MATALDTYAPFDAGAGSNVTEDTWRQFMQYMTGRSTAAMNGVLRGVANQFEVYGDSTGMQIKVKTGECWIKGHWGKSTSEKTLAIAAADPTNARKDRVVLRADFVNNRVELDVKTGTPAGSPTAPILNQVSTQWEISLAIVDVPALDNSIAANQVGDARHFVDNIDVTGWLTADQTKTSNVTLASLTDLTFLLSSGGLYAIDGMLEYSASTTGDIQWRLTGTTGGSGRHGGPGLSPAATTTAGNIDATTQPIGTSVSFGGAGAGTKISTVVLGWIAAPEASPGGSLNTATFSWAQNVSDGAASTLYLGSWVRLRRL